jgi:hypothetical protein
MNLGDKLREFVEGNSDGDPMELAGMFYETAEKTTLIQLLAGEIQNIQREMVKELERAAFSEELFRRFPEGVAFKMPEPSERFAKLMENKFAMGDGRVVAWGKATIKEHQMRIEMLKKQRDGIDETIRFHEKAIEIIESANATCLDEALSVAK